MAHVNTVLKKLHRTNGRGRDLELKILNSFRQTILDNNPSRQWARPAFASWITGLKHLPKSQTREKIGGMAEKNVCIPFLVQESVYSIEQRVQLKEIRIDVLR